MNKQLALGLCSSTLAITTAFATLLLSGPPAVAQNPELQAKLAQIKVASAANKQALSHYNWQESVTTSIKGEVKKQQLFHVYRFLLI